MTPTPPSDVVLRAALYSAAQLRRAYLTPSRVTMPKVLLDALEQEGRRDDPDRWRPAAVPAFFASLPIVVDDALHPDEITVVAPRSGAEMVVHTGCVYDPARQSWEVCTSVRFGLPAPPPAPEPPAVTRLAFSPPPGVGRTRRR